MSADTTDPVGINSRYRLSDVRLLYAAIGFSLAIVVVLCVFGLSYLRYENLARTQLLTENLSHSVEQNISGLVKDIDIALQHSADEISHQWAEGRPNKDSITRFLARQQALLPGADLLRATDAEGVAIYGVGIPQTPASVAQRDYYKKLRDDPQAGLVISEPVVGKISQKWIWLMARRYNTPDGSFGGLVYGSAFIDTIKQRFDELKLPTGSVVVLRDREMKLIARSSFGIAQDVPIGDARVSNEFKAAIATQPTGGVFRSGSTTPDGVARIYSYRVNAEHGFVALVGIPVDAALHEWRNIATSVTLLLLLTACGYLYFARALGKSWHQQRADMHSLMASQVQLQEAKELAEAATRAKSDFLSNMSHEIRTPLNAIAGMANLVRQEPLTATQADRLRKMELATRHLTTTISDILDLSKIDANSLVLEDQSLRPRDIVMNVAEILETSAKAKGLEIDVNMVDLPGSVRGDSTRITQALLNLGSNAVKFTSQGKITLSACLVEKKDDVATIRFEVCDTGIGIAKDQQQHLFKPFSQAESSTTRLYGGTGLGLTITKKLAHAMGGTAGVESELARGSKFWFTVHVQIETAEESEIETASVDPELPPDQLTKLCEGRLVLLAEDDDFNQEIATFQLENLGFRVDVAVNGVEAVERAKTTHYDLIFMDMRMPVMDGLTATTRIRQLTLNASTPIIALTANAFSDDREKCLNAGMTYFITKPVEQKVLREAILQLLGHGHSVAPGR